MTLDELHCIAKQSDISILHTDCEKSGSMSIVSESGRCYIGIDNGIASETDELVRTAHEVGHCKTGAFYSIYTLLPEVSKMEYKADKWAIQQLIPPNELYSAIENGCRDDWSLADYFGVTANFVRRALYIYTAMDIIKPISIME